MAKSKKNNRRTRKYRTRKYRTRKYRTRKYKKSRNRMKGGDNREEIAFKNHISRIRNKQHLSNRYRGRTKTTASEPLQTTLSAPSIDKSSTTPIPLKVDSRVPEQSKVRVKARKKLNSDNSSNISEKQTSPLQTKVSAPLQTTQPISQSLEKTRSSPVTEKETKQVNSIDKPIILNESDEDITYKYVKLAQLKILKGGKDTSINIPNDYRIIIQITNTDIKVFKVKENSEKIDYRNKNLVKASLGEDVTDKHINK